MPKIAVFPGSFDPITKGHQDIVLRALPLFDKVIVGIGYNGLKQGLFTVERRAAMIKQTFAEQPKVEVLSFEGLTATFCKRVDATHILRGLRNGIDLEFERGIADANLHLQPGLETVFLICSPQFVTISSTLVRDILKHGGDASVFVPNAIDLSVRG